MKLYLYENLKTKGSLERRYALSLEEDKFVIRKEILSKNGWIEIKFGSAPHTYFKAEAAYLEDFSKAFDRLSKLAALK